MDASSSREIRVFNLLKLDSKKYDKLIPPSMSTENLRILSVVAELRPDLVRTNNEFEKVEITQYLPLSQTLEVVALPMLNLLLQNRKYLVGDKLTLADVVLFDALGQNNTILSTTKKYEHLTDYMTRMSAVFEVNISSSSSSNSTPPLDINAKKTKKEKPEAKSSSESAAAAGSIEGDTLDPSKLDIRVGLVVKCWNHPESEKLLCEEIDVGEGTVRTIASGLRAHYTSEEVQGRKVLVLANLKERPMAGFMSQGMVLCACNEDHTVVRLLEPPQDAVAGDRVTFPGFTGEPALATHVAKKKILEKLAPQVCIYT